MTSGSSVLETAITGCLDLEIEFKQILFPFFSRE